MASKNIVILCDGTGNEFGTNNTNIAKIAQLAIYDDNTQLVYYDQGVGTVNFFGFSPRNLVKMELGKAFGWGIEDNIFTLYTYLMNVYRKGDKVYIFGFSRGGYTARALADVLHKVGLLYRGTEELAPQLAKLYVAEAPDSQKLIDFKQALCQECIPHFLGIFDSVASRGYLSRKQYPLDTTLYPDISHAYHALSIDEKRYKFKPLPFKVQDNLNVKQVWFSGCHCDIGGFYSDSGLSNLPLRWMLDKAEFAGLQLSKDWRQYVRCNFMEHMHESYVGLWKLWKPFMRVIPEGSYIHRSVLNRIKLVKDYKPTNLPNDYKVEDY